MYVTRYLFLEIREQKHIASDTRYYINNDYANDVKFMKVISNSTQCKKAQKNKKLVFRKKIVENADFINPYWTKIMTTYE